MSHKSFPRPNINMSIPNRNQLFGSRCALQGPTFSRRCLFSVVEECECEWDDATRGAGIYERLLVVAGEEDVADEGGRGEAGRVWGGACTIRNVSYSHVHRCKQNTDRHPESRGVRLSWELDRTRIRNQYTRNIEHTLIKGGRVGERGVRGVWYNHARYFHTYKRRRQPQIQV